MIGGTQSTPNDVAKVVWDNSQNKIKKSNAHIRNTPELFQQVSREESYEGVFRGDNLIGGIDMLRFNLSTCIEMCFWEILVDEYRPGRPWHLLARKEVLNLERCEFGVPSCDATLVANGWSHMLLSKWG